jgi:citrate synthase
VSADQAARDGIARLRGEKKAIPGFGHPQHAEGDPRANLLLRLADERGVSGEHVALMRALQAALPETVGRALPVNVNGPIPAILLDIGWPLAALKGIGLLCRTAGLIGHLTEEAERPIGFILSGAAAAAIKYDGPQNG